MAFAILPQQSPIDIGAAKPTGFPFPAESFVLNWDEHASGSLIMDSAGGHGPEFRFTHPASGYVDLLLPGQVSVLPYDIESLHFHSRSEHKVNRADWPLEMHIVHSRMESDPFNPGQQRKIFVVLGVFLDKSKGKADDREPDDSFFERYINRISDAKAKSRKTDPKPETIDPRELLPADQSRYWRYEGSLTTDTTALNGGFVSWVIFEDIKYLKPGTFDRYVKEFAHASKPIQDLDRRYVFYRPGAPSSSGPLIAG